MTETDMLNFVKALADTDRLRIIGLLAQKSASLTEISQDLGFHPSDTCHHLDQLLQSGMICLTNGIYELDSDAFEKLSRRQFEGKRGAYAPAADL
jgi:predicted transcriptional regulator